MVTNIWVSSSMAMDRPLVCMVEWQDPHISEVKARISSPRAPRTTGTRLVQRVSLKISVNLKNAKSSFSKMVPDIKVNGKIQSVTEKASRYGQTVQSTRVTGKIIKLMERELSGTSTGTNMKENGKEIRLTVMASIPIATVPPTKETGEMISSTVRVLNSGTITQNMRVNIREERNTDKELILGKMALNTLVNGMRIEFMVAESTPGMMGESTKVIGKTIIWTATLSIHGKMVGRKVCSQKKKQKVAKKHFF